MVLHGRNGRLSKKIIQGHLALKIKRMVEFSPSLSYKDMENELRKEASHGERVPCYNTIRRFLLQSGYQMVKLIKKPFIPAKNIQNRLIFAENGL